MQAAIGFGAEGGVAVRPDILPYMALMRLKSNVRLSGASSSAVMRTAAWAGLGSIIVGIGILAHAVLDIVVHDVIQICLAETESSPKRDVSLNNCISRTIPINFVILNHMSLLGIDRLRRGISTKHIVHTREGG